MGLENVSARFGRVVRVFPSRHRSYSTPSKGGGCQIFHGEHPMPSSFFIAICMVRHFVSHNNNRARTPCSNYQVIYCTHSPSSVSIYVRALNRHFDNTIYRNPKTNRPADAVPVLRKAVALDADRQGKLTGERPWKHNPYVVHSFPPYYQ